MIGISTGFIQPAANAPQYRVISPNTVNVRIDELYLSEMEQMKKEFETVKYICGTADVWSTKRKSFMGVTVHWVDEKTLDRKSRALCCRRFESPHDAERIATLLNVIYVEFGIDGKVIGTVTDNASNFVKAFEDFGISLESFFAFMSENNGDDERVSNSSVDEIDENDNFENEESIDFIEFGDVNMFLGAHFRCGSHTCFRVATHDAKAAFSDAMYEEQHDSAFSKLNSLYKKTNRPKSSEIIRDVLKVALVLPVKTRWNSLFDSVEHILKFELKTLNTLMLALDLPQFTQADYDFLVNIFA